MTSSREASVSWRTTSVTRRSAVSRSSAPCTSGTRNPPPPRMTSFMAAPPSDRTKVGRSAHSTGAECPLDGIRERETRRLATARARSWGRAPPPLVRPAGVASHRRRPAARRVRLGHRLPRHDLRRAAERAQAGHRGVGRRPGLVPRRHRQPRRRDTPARSAHRARGSLQRRRLRRLLLAHARAAGGHRPRPQPPLRRLAQPRDGVDVGRPRPQHGVPRPPVTGGRPPS